MALIDRTRHAWRHHPAWAVWAVIAAALLSTFVLFDSDTRDLDPHVWQAIVAGADISTPDLFDSRDGETR